VLELFFQVFDKGVLDDAEGRQIDFRNTIIILTSNAASPDHAGLPEQAGRRAAGAGELADADPPGS
jgi:ATP-dependent Clp protease ATP-binding subunit ClpA